MLFWLKKAVTFWLMPLPICLTLIAAGWWLTRRAHRRRSGRFLLTAGLLLLVLLSNRLVSVRLLRPLEAEYAPIGELAPGEALPPALAACRYVAVLGGGQTDMRGLPAASQLSPASLARLMEGLRLLRLLPEARLIVSGPGYRHHRSLAATQAQASVALGVDRSRILLVDTARDTEDESVVMKAIVGEAPIALVTSAWHMPRAAALFRAAGVNALPCPADFNARIAPEFRWTDLGWDAESLNRSTEAIHERLGYLWLSLRGKSR